MLRFPTIRPILHALWEVERSQTVPSAVVDDIRVRHSGVQLAGPALCVVVSPTADREDVIAAMMAFVALDPIDETRTGLYPIETDVPARWQELHHDLAMLEGSLEDFGAPLR